MNDIVYSSMPHFTAHEMANVYTQPNRYCNYECSYCWPSSHTKVKDFVDAEKLYKTIDDLCEKFYDRGVRQINWGWSGGEATFHPNFLDFQKRILSNDYLYHSFNMTSNLSHNLSWWKKFIRETDKFLYRTISASLHQEFVDTPAKVEKFEEKVVYLKSKISRVIINQVMDMDLFYDQLEVLREIQGNTGVDARPKVNSRQLIQHRKFGNMDAFDSDQMNIMNNYYSESNNTKRNMAQVVQLTNDNQVIYLDDQEQLKLNNFWHGLSDWFCTAGHLSIAIDRNVIKRGVGACRDQVIGTVGEDFDLHTVPQKCGIKEDEVCSCVADLKLPKWKEGFDIKSFLEKEKHDPVGR